MTTDEVRRQLRLEDELFSTLCGNCNHPARRHFGYTAACAECWKQLLTICERFKLKAEDRERVEALYNELGVTGC